MEQHKDEPNGVLNMIGSEKLNKAILQKSSLFQGDCLEIMKSIPDKSIDMVLCDLPYG